jgi:hypothetical protein
MICHQTVGEHSKIEASAALNEESQIRFPIGVITKDIKTTYSSLSDVMSYVRHNDASYSSHGSVLSGGAGFIYGFGGNDFQGLLR